MRNPWLEPKRPAILSSQEVNLTFTNILLSALSSKHDCTKEEMKEALEHSIIEMFYEYCYPEGYDGVIRSQTRVNLNNGLKQLEKIAPQGRIRIAY